MGGGTYCCSTRALRTETLGYLHKTSAEIFTQRTINNAMSPEGIVMRESRDSKEHPESLALILALDLTGSMGDIPLNLVRDGLPAIMGKIMQKGIKDPQLLFVGVGDHECDRAPLQVGQFETSDELLDQWLTKIWLEGGGGGNAGESYLLAWYFAGHKTAIDCFEKRKQKGFLFTIGDEPTLTEVPKHAIEKMMGKGQHDDYTASSLLAKAKETYNVYHIHVKQGSAGRRQEVMDGWKQLMGENLILVDDYKTIPAVIVDKIISVVGATKPLKADKKETKADKNDEKKEDHKPILPML